MPSFRVININHSCEYGADNIPFLRSPKLKVTCSDWLQNGSQISLARNNSAPNSNMYAGAGFPRAPSSSPTSIGCLIIPLNSDITYPETASDPAG